MLRCVRTTLTLDDDVVAELERLRQARRLGLKEAVNLALRHGLRDLERQVRHPPGERFRTEPLSTGPSLVGRLDDIASVLAESETGGRP